MEEDKWSDSEFILGKIEWQDCSILEKASNSLKNDKTFILQAVAKNGRALEHAAETLKKDREIVLQAIKRNGNALKFADETLKKDQEIVLQAITRNGDALKHADETLKKDREFLIKAVKRNGDVLEYVIEELKTDREIVLQAVQQNGYALEYANESFKQDCEFILQAVEQNGTVLRYVDASLKGDILFVSELSKQNVVLSRSFSPLLTKKIEDEILSKDIIKLYSEQFNSENDLYKCIDKPNSKPSKAIKTLFNLNPTYSIDFVEKLIIYQILKRLYNPESPNDVFYGESVNYHFFCFKLNEFLVESNIQTTSVKDLKKTVEAIAEKFDVSHYSKKEINTIMYFYTKWTKSDQSFNGYKEILSKYNELHGDSSKIFTALIRYHNDFKGNYNFISILGHGGEGVVFKVLHKESNTLRAIKFKFETEENEESAEELINLLKRTDMKGKIKCFDCGLIERHLYSVMELGEESLYNFIQSNIEIYRKLPEEMTKEKLIEILEIYIKILDSVQSIHDHNILHRDLDPQNIVRIEDEYKIIDFETSKVVKIGNSITIARGKYSYMSPEVSHDNYNDELLKSDDDQKLAHNDGNITIKCDIFSMGCIFLKLLTNCPLQLDEHFVNDSDISKYKDDYPYFTAYGKYFYTVVTLSEGEIKLHYAIQKLINNSINVKFGVNLIIIRCIITMIQRDSNKRLDCYSYKTTLKNVVQYLKGDITKENFKMFLEKDMGKYKEITSLKTYSQLLDENNKMAAKIKKLEEEIRKLQSRQ